LDSNLTSASTDARPGSVYQVFVSFQREFSVIWRKVSEPGTGSTRAVTAGGSMWAGSSSTTSRST
jgi:hypothetical protein